jgi:hypothetical protein
MAVTFSSGDNDEPKIVRLFRNTVRTVNDVTEGFKEALGIANYN